MAKDCTPYVRQEVICSDSLHMQKFLCFGGTCSTKLYFLKLDKIFLNTKLLGVPSFGYSVKKLIEQRIFPSILQPFLRKKHVTQDFILFLTE